MRFIQYDETEMKKEYRGCQAEMVVASIKEFESINVFFDLPLDKGHFITG